jgi:DNA-3-methyladenine glycosylase II
VPRKASAPKAAGRKASSPRKAASPRKTSPPRKTSTSKAPTVTASARKATPRKALAHLRASDPVLAAIIEQVGKLPDTREGRPARDDHYGALVRSIVGQQLSVLAARAIYGRLTDRFAGRPPTPQEILADEPEELRAAAGLSRAKVGFLRSLAEHVISGELELELLDDLPDDEVIAELVAVKGLGVWTSHMFLMFQLERPDVLAVGDLGIRRAIERAYGLDSLPDAEEMEAIAEPWRPYRTLACRYLWRSLQNEPT